MFNSYNLSFFILIIIFLLSGFNFMPFSKFYGFPVFQSLILLYFLFSLVSLKINRSLILFKPFKFYYYYILSLLVPLGIGFFFKGQIVFQTFFYSCIPLLLFLFSFNKIDYRNFIVLIYTLLISVFLISLLGWAIRLEILPYYFFYDVLESEFNLGYWGISYQTSSRNHDYVYPLVGSAISLYFYKNNSNKFILVFMILLNLFFVYSLISSLSRGALIISTISLFLMFDKNVFRFSLILFVMFLIYLFVSDSFFNFISSSIKPIFLSIFELKNSDSKFSNAVRIQIILDAFKYSLINPLGFGIDNYSFIYRNSSSIFVNSAENAFLTLLVERGWFSFLFFFKFIFLFVFSFTKDLKSLSSILGLFLFIYFLFNYELNNSFVNFVLFVLIMDSYLKRTLYAF